MALAAVRELKKATPAKGLAALIDRAGEENELQKAHKAAYEQLRGEIAIRMPVEADEDIKIEIGHEYQAKNSYPVEQSIDPEKLFKYNRQLFWRLVKVNLGDAQKQIPPLDFDKLVSKKYADVPRLTITKIDKKKAA